MSILLFLGPIFIFLYLFGGTRAFFEKWLQQLATYAFIPLLTSGVLMLTLSITNTTLGSLISGATKAISVTEAIAPFIGFQTLNAFFLTQVMSKAAALGGGISIAGIDSATQWATNNARNIFQNSKNMGQKGANAAKAGAQVASSFAKRATNFAKNRIFNRNATMTNNAKR